MSEDLNENQDSTSTATAPVAEPEQQTEYWVELERLLDENNAEALTFFVELIPPGEIAYAINHLDEPDQQKLLELIPAEMGRWVLEHISDEQAARLVGLLEAPQAARILDELESDDQADVLSELTDEMAEEILGHMDPEEATDARLLVTYEPDTAGGIMITEYLAYPGDRSVTEVIQDLRENQEEYAEYMVQYIYVTDEAETLVGICRLQDLMLAPGSAKLKSRMMDKAVISVLPSVGLNEVEDIFDHHDIYAVPVVEVETNRLIGVVRRAALQEALGERSDKAMMRSGGIIAGEEVRSMRVLPRAARRLVFLVPNIGLGIVSISIIALYEEVVAKVVALAIFLPLVAGLCGNSANQAIAVSMRELAMDLTRPSDVMRVFWKEASVGVLVGLVLGVLVFLVAGLWQSDWALGAVIGAAIPLTVIVACVVGGTTPLLLRKINLDPAMASGPIVMTMVDLCGFFVVLKLAMFFINHLV